MKRAEELYSKLKQALRSFEGDRFLQWKTQTESVITHSLSSPLLGEKVIMNVDDLRLNSKKQVVTPELQEKVRKMLCPDLLEQLPVQGEQTDASALTQVYQSPSVSALLLRLCGCEICVNFPS